MISCSVGPQICISSHESETIEDQISVWPANCCNRRSWIVLNSMAAWNSGDAQQTQWSAQAAYGSRPHTPSWSPRSDVGQQAPITHGVWGMEKPWCQVIEEKVNWDHAMLAEMQGNVAETKGLVKSLRLSKLKPRRSELKPKLAKLKPKLSDLKLRLSELMP